jgi:hypothetical protein
LACTPTETEEAEALPYEDGSFDVVASIFGAMFAPRPERGRRDSTGPAQPPRTPRLFPTFVNASTARSMWAGSWAADSCTRMRESPFATTG